MKGVQLPRGKMNHASIVYLSERIEINPNAGALK